MSAVARVVTEVALDRVFDYAVPADLSGLLQPGHRVKVPFGGRVVTGYVVELADSSPLDSLKVVRARVEADPLVTPPLMQLARWIADYYLCPIEIALRSILPAAVRDPGIAARLKRFVHVLREPSPDEAATLAKRGGARARALESLRNAGPVTARDAQVKLKVSPALLRGLCDMGLVEVTSREVARDPFEGVDVLPTQPLALNAEQAEAVTTLLAACDAPGPPPFLLHGVTGSGKTEVYLQVIQGLLDRGRGAILLVPEIALTPQSVEHFRARFATRGVGVAVLHSRLSDGERRDEWHRIRNGHAPVVVGARSAVFAPVARLGAILVDEEHEGSYKQAEAPRYHARDVAVMRGKIEGVPVVLGSATPSLESFHNTERGKYRLLTMPSRVDSRAMPDVHVVDLRTESMRSQGALLFSRRLHGAVIDRLDRAEQVILFLNRRGYSTAVICPACGHVTECPRCSISLTWHRRAGRLKCHLCGHDEAPRPACPKCGAERLRHAGAGTERIESSVARLFPTARVARMDSDVMTRKGDYERVFSDFRAGRIDILVGTQMIAKGLHFPNVTLVGVVNADLALHLPDFRAAERVFQLLTQVSGRAGRGDVPGEVIVQSHTPYHPAIQFAKRHDFAGFYEHEIAFRRQFGYPPCRRATLIHIRSRSLERAVFVAQSLARRLAAVLPASVDIGGPAPAPIDRIDEFHRQQIFLRGAQSKQLAPVWPALRREHETDDVALVIDVDPLSLL